MDNNRNNGDGGVGLIVGIVVGVLFVGGIIWLYAIPYLQEKNDADEVKVTVPDSISL